MMKRNLPILFCLLALTTMVEAQQLPVYQHSFLIRSAYNPAEILNIRNESAIYALRGNQFQRFQGGFVNNYVNFATPLDNVNVGLGLDMASRSYGPINQLSFGFAYAYRVKFNKHTSLIFGTRMGFIEHKFNTSLINPFDEEDPIINAIPIGHIIPNGSIGASFTTKAGIFELAIPQLLSNKFLNTAGNNTNRSIILHPHIFTRYSVDFHVKKDVVKLTPIVSIRYLPGTLAQYETGLTVFFRNQLWINANYRSGYSASLGAGVRVNETWTIGYSFDRPIKNVYNFNANNHEVVLGYTFNRGRAKAQEIEWNQTQNNPNKMKMDSVSDVQDVTMAEEFLKNKLTVVKTKDTLIDNVDFTRSEGSDYKSITVEVNLADSVFADRNTAASNLKSGKDKKVDKDDKITQEKIEQKLKHIEEDEFLGKINKNAENKIKIIRNEQPSEKTFVEISGEDCTRGYYLITGVFSTLERAQSFRWKNDSEQSKIIFNKKNQYFYVVHSYSESKSLEELEPILKEYRSKNLKIWILDY